MVFLLVLMGIKQEGHAMYQVNLINFGYALNDRFATFNEAVAAGKKAGFEFAVQIVGGNAIAGWSPITGLRMVSE